LLRRFCTEDFSSAFSSENTCKKRQLLKRCLRELGCATPYVFVCVCMCVLPVVHRADMLVVEGHRISVKVKETKMFGQRNQNKFQKRLFQFNT